MFSTIQFCIYVIIFNSGCMQISNCDYENDTGRILECNLSIYSTNRNVRERVGQVIQQLCGLTTVFHTLTCSSWIFRDPLIVLVHPNNKGTWTWRASSSICLHMSCCVIININNDNDDEEKKTIKLKSLWKVGKKKKKVKVVQKGMRSHYYWSHTFATSEVSVELSVLLKHIFRFFRCMNITAPIGLASWM